MLRRPGLVTFCICFIHCCFPIPMTLAQSQSQSQVPQTSLGPTPNAVDPELELFGMSMQYKSGKKRVEYKRDGSLEVPVREDVKITLHGIFPPEAFFKLTFFKNNCHDRRDPAKVIKVVVHPSRKYGHVKLKTPKLDREMEKKAYVCMGKDANSLKLQGDQGSGNVYPWLTVIVHASNWPAWILWAVIVVLLLLSGLFSGLNLGILSLDRMDLKIMINTGSPSERAHARKIRPIRANGNLLLCSLVFSNVLVNSVLTLLMDSLTDGVTAVIFSTVSIVICGEIIPQAVCSRYGLQVAGYTLAITKFFMILTFIFAFPLSKLLDQFLGEEIGVSFTRERLKEIVKAAKDEHGLENEEVGIISGALDLKNKSVKGIMRRIGDMFMLPIETVLDFETMLMIENKGYSRVPIYDREITNVIGILNVKQLIMVDYKDSMPLRDLVDLNYFKDNLFCVFENTRLDFMFRKFREGNRGHMAFVDRVNDEGPGDPYYERIGVVTMEDVLEELLQQPIMDESDVGTYSARLEVGTGT